MIATLNTLSTLEGALIKLRSAFDAHRITGEQYARGALYLEGRIESIRAELADPAAGLLVIEGDDAEGDRLASEALAYDRSLVVLGDHDATTPDDDLMTTLDVHELMDEAPVGGHGPSGWDFI
jgi:hypothetical protein